MFQALFHFSGKFQRFGSGGFGSTFVSVCFMNLNNVNEKVFLILWALLWLLISTSGQIRFHSIDQIDPPWLRDSVAIHAT